MSAARSPDDDDDEGSALPKTFALSSDVPTGDWRQDIDRPPLGSLVTMTLRALVDRVLEKGVAQGGMRMRAAHLYLLRNLHPDGVTVTELAESTDVTKQAVSQLLDMLEDKRLVRRLPDPHDGRGKIVKLTRRGQRELAIVVNAYTEVEREWADVIGGPAEMQRVREAMFAFIEKYADWHRGDRPKNRIIW
jgi:DNA-binding MarR family transcriptional regulator